MTDREKLIEREPPYLISYMHKGEGWSFTIWAESWEDAELRLRAIADNGKVIGSNVHDVPCGPSVRLAIDNSGERPDG